jgi:hypothetical protein
VQMISLSAERTMDTCQNDFVIFERRSDSFRDAAIGDRKRLSFFDKIDFVQYGCVTDAMRIQH